MYTKKCAFDRLFSHSIQYKSKNILIREINLFMWLFIVNLTIFMKLWFTWNGDRLTPGWHVTVEPDANIAGQIWPKIAWFFLCRFWIRWPCVYQYCNQQLSTATTFFNCIIQTTLLRHETVIRNECTSDVIYAEITLNAWTKTGQSSVHF